MGGVGGAAVGKEVPRPPQEERTLYHKLEDTFESEGPLPAGRLPRGAILGPLGQEAGVLGVRAVRHFCRYRWPVRQGEAEQLARSGGPAAGPAGPGGAGQSRPERDVACITRGGVCWFSSLFSDVSSPSACPSH